MSDSARQKRLFLVILILFSLFFVVGYTSRMLKKNQMEQEVRQWQERIVQAQQKGVALEDELAHVRSEAFVHESAREVLGLVQPDDTLIVEVPARRVAETAPTLSEGAIQGSPPAPVRMEQAQWQEWLQLFWPAGDNSAQP